MIRRLVRISDVLIENFKSGEMAALGLGYEQLRQENVGLVYCAITGYGQTGPDKDLPGYDFIIQGRGGVMSITGEAEGEPMKVGVAITDITAGLFAANAIQAALLARTKTGQGQAIDISLLDAQVAWLANVGSNYLVSGTKPGRYGNAHPSIVPYQSFQAQDGYFCLAVGNDANGRNSAGLLPAPSWRLTNDFPPTRPGCKTGRSLFPFSKTCLTRTRYTAGCKKFVPRGLPVGPFSPLMKSLRMNRCVRVHARVHAASDRRRSPACRLAAQTLRHPGRVPPPAAFIGRAYGRSVDRVAGLFGAGGRAVA